MANDTSMNRLWANASGGRDSPFEPRGFGGQFEDAIWSAGDEGNSAYSLPRAHSADQPALSLSAKCRDEWNQARILCLDLMQSRRLGPKSGFGKSFDKCVGGMVSARCGGNQIG